VRHGTASTTTSAPLVASLIVVLATVAAWAWIVPMAVDMYGPMTGASAWMMRSVWDTPHIVLLWLMWAVMMAAMMLPSALPLVLMYSGLVRRRQQTAAVAHTMALVSGYVFAWAAFSAAATALQLALHRALLLTPMMEMPDRRAAAVVLLGAGIYQFTPWKATCLTQCRSPLSFVMTRWRAGAGGALIMGAHHGAYCIGCCWALMALLFVGGVMNLAVILALTALVAIEKVTPLGVAASRAFGALLIGTGAYWLL
jgi:predicted metal-binding membrane protein